LQVIVVDWTAEPSQPAPGCHNSELYPEMDSQPIPTDMREKMAAVKKATVKKATVKKAREREKSNSRQGKQDNTNKARRKTRGHGQALGRLRL
jgi:hypothetical protein